VIDLLGQLSDGMSADRELRAAARQAMDAVNRGVLAYTAVA
jgi:ATP-dependent RNA helicase HelY